MKKIAVFALLLQFAGVAFAQEWHLDLEKAQQLAGEQNKKIVLAFSGSDWCAPCMKLEKEVWSSDEFKSYAAAHFVLVKADFPRRKKNKLSAEQEEENALLAERYNKGGYFPYVVVLNAEGEVLGSAGYEKIAPMEYAKLLDAYN